MHCRAVPYCAATRCKKMPRDLTLTCDLDTVLVTRLRYCCDHAVPTAVPTSLPSVWRRHGRMPTAAMVLAMRASVSCTSPVLLFCTSIDAVTLHHGTCGPLCCSQCRCTCGPLCCMVMGSAWSSWNSRCCSMVSTSV